MTLHSHSYLSLSTSQTIERSLKQSRKLSTIEIMGFAKQALCLPMLSLDETLRDIASLEMLRQTVYPVNTLNTFS